MLPVKIFYDFGVWLIGYLKLREPIIIDKEDKSKEDAELRDHVRKNLGNQQEPWKLVRTLETRKNLGNLMTCCSFYIV